MIDWNKYSRTFKKNAAEAGLSVKQISNCLKYAKKLNNNNLPIIFDIKHFSLLVGYQEEYILRAINSSQLFYRTFFIQKKNGSKRKIDEPLPSLKEIQKWILNNILYKIKVSKYAKAFIPKTSLKDNAKYHKKQKIVLTVDIENFFGSIKFIEVFKVFRKIGYSKGVSVLLSNVCTLNNALPQGAPTSPYLSNLVFIPLDNRISSLWTKNNIRYTRYADDLTFSGDFNPGYVINFVSKILRAKKLRLNPKKIRAMYQSQRQEITGIVVNKKMQTPLSLRKRIRQEIYYIKKFGLVSHLEHEEIYRANYNYYLLGKINFVKFIDPKDLESKKNYEYLKKLTLIKNTSQINNNYLYSD